MEVVGLVKRILHELQWFQMRAGYGKALKEECACLDAIHDGIAGYCGGF